MAPAKFILNTNKIVDPECIITVDIHLRYFHVSDILFNIKLNHFIFLVTSQGKPPPPIPTLPPVPIMKNLPTSFRCNFDADVCGMTQDKTDKENYILHRGLTPNPNTGPSRDHTTGRGKILQTFNVFLSFNLLNLNFKLDHKLSCKWRININNTKIHSFFSGKYLYFNGNVRRTHNAIICTPWFKRQYKFCIKFHYHMYGTSMGGLRVYAFEKKKSIKHGERKFLWEKLDNQKNKWHVARITYTPQHKVEVYIHVCVCVCVGVCVWEGCIQSPRAYALPF